jgi:ectoine hydroxylase-related dioxygenase (phytanoyl-CoA dioxygenase family)
MNIHIVNETGFYNEEACRLEEFSNLTGRTVDRVDLPNAIDAPSNIPLYDARKLSAELTSPTKRRVLMAEWARILHSGAGVFVLKGACDNKAAIDQATDLYDQIIAREKQANSNGADHFAAAGNNDRIWNSLQKLCEASPDVFIDYFANPVIDAACEAWLGPNYQMTAQINMVHPGGKAQQAHRDYHLGFQTADVSATYPAHVHDLSPLMTLQGGIAHCDMPLESGPTKLLPFSQLYRPGYAAWRRDDFRAHFEANCVQLPLEMGDAFFFSPAIFHAAGENISADVHRMVNLLQVSSAFGRAMESVDRQKMCRLVFEPLARKWGAGALSEAELDAVIAATAEGYSFPTNLDRDPPVGGLAPMTDQAFLKQCVQQQTTADELVIGLDKMNQRRLASG